MQLKKIKVGSITVKNNIFLAPVAGFTDFSFRSLANELGIGMCFTELISSKALVFENQKTQRLLITHKNEKITAAQIFGSDPCTMRKACERLLQFEIIDINMGCPVPKLYKNGDGSALLDNLNLASQIIKSCVKSGKTITVKMRTGITRNKKITADFASMCEQSGASLVTIHARTREDYYSGEPDFEEIAKAKQAVKIPVIANGAIYTADDACKMIKNTGADGVMLARGALYEPFLISALTGITPPFSKREMINMQIDKLNEKFSDDYTSTVMRKRLIYYMKNMPSVKKYKNLIFACDNTKDLKNLVLEIF